MEVGNHGVKSMKYEDIKVCFSVGPGINNCDPTNLRELFKVYILENPDKGIVGFYENLLYWYYVDSTTLFVQCKYPPQPTQPVKDILTSAASVKIHMDIDYITTITNSDGGFTVKLKFEYEDWKTATIRISNNIFTPLVAGNKRIIGKPMIISQWFITPEPRVWFDPKLPKRIDKL
jgi:hypothetical protein